MKYCYFDLFLRLSSINTIGYHYYGFISLNDIIKILCRFFFSLPWSLGLVIKAEDFTFREELFITFSFNGIATFSMDIYHCCFRQMLLLFSCIGLLAQQDHRKRESAMIDFVKTAAEIGIKFLHTGNYNTVIAHSGHDL